MDCNPALARGHYHIIMANDYFMKWDEAIPTVKSDDETTAHFVFNQIITWFGILKELVTNHGRHFQNRMMEELALKLGYKQEHSSSYYPQANGQVEAVNKSLKVYSPANHHTKQDQLEYYVVSCFVGLYNHD